MKKNGIIFKGNKKGINIILDEDLEFKELKSLMTQKLSDANRFFDGARTAITFSGRELTDAEEGELLDIISERSQINISFVGNTPEPERTLISFSHMENSTYYHKGNLRSGQEIRYGGSVVLIGDVNPGGGIIAEGNIIILGILKGAVHAGCTGNRQCYIAALDLRPTQIRIADIITYMPDSRKHAYHKDVTPARAYANDGKIYIEPLTN